MDKTITTEEKERVRIVDEKEPNDNIETGGEREREIQRSI